jgi:hypothetical protein
VAVPIVAVLMVAGFHVPVIAGIFIELAGSAGAVEFWHNGPIAVNVGVMFGLTVIVNVFDVAHCPVFGVKV